MRLFDDIRALERFTKAQEETYKQAITELKAGHKETHWMWWVFPQYKGLGNSDISQLYAIQSREEARAYWEHPVLGKRLRECIKALLDLKTNDAEEIFGPIDALKLKSCMTLFYYHGGMGWCGDVLDKFFPREFCWETIGILMRE